MTKIEIWGPVAWTFFHTIIEKINNKAPSAFIWDVFNKIKFICSALPCPECSEHATAFLSKFTPQHVNTKEKLKNVIYVFHNSVNARKRKPLYNYANINIYDRYRLLQCFENFKLVYNTKGNMQMLNDSFRRTLILNDVNKWLYGVLHMFVFNDAIKPIGAIKSAVINITPETDKVDVAAAAADIMDVTPETDKVSDDIMDVTPETDKVDAAADVDIMELEEAEETDDANIMELEETEEIEDANIMELEEAEETKDANIMELEEAEETKDANDNWGMSMSDVLNTINEDDMEDMIE